jgi:hypothetical protein
VAIGGINLENLEDVMNAGADSAAMISALVSDPAKSRRKYANCHSSGGKCQKMLNIVQIILALRPLFGNNSFWLRPCAQKQDH